MPCANGYIEFLVTITQFTVAYLLVHYLGYIFGILVIISIMFFWKVYTEHILEMVPLTSSDKNLLSSDFFQRQNILSQLEIENFNSESLYKEIYEKAYMRVPKMRTVLKYKYFNFYWAKSNKTNEEIISERLVLKKAMTTEEIEEFKIAQLQEEMDPFINPIIFYIIPYEESKLPNGDYTKGCFIVKLDHCFSDGIGLVSLLTCMGDNYSPDLFPKVMHIKNINFWTKLLDFVLFVIIGIPICLYYASTIKSRLKMSYLPRTKQTAFTNPIEFDFNKIKEKSKLMKMSINEICIAALISAVAKYKVGASKINLEVPLGLSPLPKDVYDLNLTNHVFALFQEMNLYDDIMKNYQQFKQDYNSLIKQTLFVRVSDWGAYLAYKILPFNISKSIITKIIHEADIICSNLPGPTDCIYLKDNKVTSILAYTTTGYIPNLFPIVTYNGKLKILGIYDAGQDFDCEILVKFFETSMNDILNNNNKEYDTINKNTEMETKTNILYKEHLK